MPKSDLIFGSFNTATYDGNFYKLKPINFPTPGKDVKTISVPGRNGDVIIDNGSYKNIELTAEIVIESQTAFDDFISLYDALRDGIMSQSGYQRLEDSFYPGEYRLARAENCSMEMTDTMNGKAIVTFDCKPQRFLKSGELGKAYTGTATTPSYKVLTNFISAAQTVITNAAKAAGFTASEAGDFDYVMIYLSGYSLTAGDVLSFEFGSDDPFFAAYFQSNPTSATGASPFVWNEKSLYFTSSALASYVVVKRDFNLRIYKNGVLQDDDAAFDYFTLTNPTRFSSHPLIKFHLTSTNMSDYIGGVNECGVYLDCDDPNLVLYADVLTVDTETMDAYCSAEDSSMGIYVNYNKYVSFSNGELTMKPGENQILANANTSSVEIIPKWWVL